MLAFKNAIEILKLNGFDSMTSYPLVYYRGDKLGLTYTFDSTHYGNLERVRLFNDEKEFDLFVKEIKWYRTYGKTKNVAIVLDDYMKENPEVSFIHNGQKINYEVMENFDKYEENTKNELETSDLKRIIFEISCLFSFYDERVEALKSYVDGVNRAMELLFDSYKTLQSRIDLYNGYKKERELSEVSIERLKLEVDITKQNELRDNFNYLKISNTTYEVFLELLKKVWSLIMDLELNETYVKSMKIHNDIVNEQEIVNRKLNYMEHILNKKRIIVYDLAQKFKKIENEYVPQLLDEHYDDIYRNDIIERFRRFGNICVYNCTSYLRDCLINNNYNEVELKYKERLAISLDSEKADENKIIQELDIQLNGLSQEEKDKLTLLNSEYFDLFNMIINVGDYKVKSGEELNQILGANPNYANIINRCYNLVSDILPFNENVDVVRVFSYLNFDSPETLLNSIKLILNDLEKISRKLKLNDDIITYFKTFNYENYNEKLMKLYFNCDRVLCEINDENLRYVIANLKKGVNVFYSNKTIIIPNDGTSEIKYVNNEYNSLSVLSANIVMDKNSDVVKVNNYRGNIVRDASYSYIDELKSSLIFNFVVSEITAK